MITARGELRATIDALELDEGNNYVLHRLIDSMNEAEAEALLAAFALAKAEGKE